MANEDEGAGATSPDQEASPERPERLGRGARTLAKVRRWSLHIGIVYIWEMFVGKDPKTSQERKLNACWMDDRQSYPNRPDL
jgi:hypothetical protein